MGNWPKSAREWCCGVGFGDSNGHPRTCREAVCGSISQTLLFQLWLSIIFNIVSMMLIIAHPLSQDDLRLPNYMDICVFSIESLVEGWMIFVIVKRYQKIWYLFFIIWAMIASTDLTYLVYPIVVRRIVVPVHFVSYIVNQSLNFSNDLFILGMSAYYFRNLRYGEHVQLEDEEEGSGVKDTPSVQTITVEIKTESPVSVHSIPGLSVN
eukprot:TRINITY_DN5429_c0_g1_i2.p1 TRINITY_DN5429_c0_g1~~TRINITY_DN5429_c0_g1_i2.p1  ORF type:complete len:209 (-),score=22.63 TRINITY_DN5429_c0_g1_i2:13-639(-)